MSVLHVACVAALAALAPVPRLARSPVDGFGAPRPVSGHGVDLLTGAVVHSQEPTPTGVILRSTEIVELEGDLVGRVLYHPTTVIDFAAGTLVNTGQQVFSGTVLGSAPVLIYDDTFRFEVDLNTGAEAGEVHLVDSLAGPKVRCDLHVVGTGRTPEGNPTFDYTGQCRLKEE